MRKIKIYDTTLRDGEQSPGCSMHANEKLEVAFALERLNVDYIEAGFAASSKGDFSSIEQIAQNIKNCAVSSLARCNEKDIDLAYDAIKKSASPRIHVFIATSQSHMEHKLHMTKEQVIESIKHHVAYAKKYCTDIEFSAEDALRSDRDFLLQALSAAIDAGAIIVDLPDTVGFNTPFEITDAFRYFSEQLADKAELGFHGHNDLGMAVANSLAAASAGASQIECTLNGIGERSGNASLEEIVMAMKTKSQALQMYTDVQTKQLYKACKLVSDIIGVQIPPTKPIIGKNAFAHESGIHQHGVLNDPTTYEIMSPQEIGLPHNEIVLGKHSGKHAFSQYLKDMGYSLSAQQIDKYFNDFKALADKKKYISSEDVESIITHRAYDLENAYILKSFVVQSHKGGAYADILATRKIELLSGSSEGFGPVDAAFNAIDKIVGKKFNLIAYSLNAVTEGEDALGEAVVKLSGEGRTMTGRGVSTDILEASILAYLDGCNKLLEA